MAGDEISDGQITAVVFSLSEAHLLQDCLPRLAQFDELLVCDMQSTDDTISVAVSHGARVLGVPRAPVVEAVRQLALDAVETEWTLFVDADELVPAGFRSTLRLDEIPHDVAAVNLRYTVVAFGRPLQHLLRDARKYSLLRTRLCHYAEPARAHQPPVFNGQAVDAPANVAPIAHMSFQSVRDVFEKTVRYARSNPDTPRLLTSPLALPRPILRDVIAGGAWRDGYTGIVLVVLYHAAQFYAAALAWEEDGYPETPWPPWTRRRLEAAGWLHRLLGRVRVTRVRL